MTDDGSVAYALRRLNMASARVQRWDEQAQRLEDRRDAMRSKAWRTRLTNELARVESLFRRAVTNVNRWRVEVRRRREAEVQAAAAQRQKERIAPPPSDELDEDVADEWELGVDYAATSGAGSNVDINIRLRRTDGHSFGLAEATRAMSSFRRNLSLGHGDPAPAGYEVAGVSWRNPERSSRGWRSGEWTDLGGLWNVLYVASDEGVWRLGSVDQ